MQVAAGIPDSKGASVQVRDESGTLSTNPAAACLRCALGAALFVGALALTGAGPATAAELLVFELPHCAPCLQFERDVGQIYSRTDEGRLAPLARLPFGMPPSKYRYVRPPVVAPTFVLVDAGREVGRIEGYSTDELFWMSLSTRLRLLHPKTGASQR